MSPGHQEKGGEGREGWRKTCPTPSAHPHLSTHPFRRRRRSSRHWFFDHIRLGFSLRSQSGEECEHLSFAWFAKAHPPLPTPCLLSQVCRALPAAGEGRPPPHSPLHTWHGTRSDSALREFVTGDGGPVGAFLSCSPSDSPGWPSRAQVVCCKAGLPLSTLSSYSPSQTRETPLLLSCSHPCCFVSISTCAWLAEGSPGVSTSQTVPGRQESAQTCQGSFTFEMSSAWLWFRGTGSQGDPTHCPVTAGTPSSTKTGSLLAQWLPVLVPHLTASAQGERRNEGQGWPITWCPQTSGGERGVGELIKKNRTKLLPAGGT